jgi:CheY-like chemotaxis protein
MKRIESQGPTPPVAPQQLLLYVEDEPANWEVTEMRLGKKFRMLWARNDREACRIVIDQGPQLAAVLMDLQLKGSVLDGLDLTRLFRGKRGPHLPDYALDVATLSCPIYFVTAHGSLYSETELDEAGGDAHVPKPVDFVKLSLLLARSNMQRAMNTLKGPQSAR